jgi:hypothetical protein
MAALRRSNRIGHLRPEGTFQIRVYHRKRNGKRDPRYLLKCGCCEKSVEVHYGGGTLEINGVMGSVEDWREILLPLLAPARASSAKPKRS